MTINRYTILVLALVLLTSCNAFKRLTAKDGSGNTVTAKKQKERNIEFLNIDVSPGSVVTTKHRTSGINQTEVSGTNQSNQHYAPILGNAGLLQLKYAIIMDATVEDINNIPLLQKIEEWWGTSYCMGGSTKNCIDCSAFTSLVMKDIYGIDIPRTAQDQFLQSERMETPDLKEGDLVFFHTQGRAVSHVGIYLNNNKFVHASTSFGVTITDLNDKYWLPKFVGCGRIRK